ncbi:EG45-like domain containing protein [Cocos nucifera]|uniref:EG45-like domain containing protein n=1 Tax=Cocos nucifera TaxID=13894 RepID=A0A8K0N277_COCNU|nr:EG45-like domain containing protein [Cocos nucifera]
MGKPLPLGLSNLLPWLLSFLLLPSPSLADVGTASFYGPPYLPTACYGSDEGQFPADNLYAASGEGIWDNGASCGREYLVRCLSSATPDACVDGQTIQVVILDHAATLNSMPSTNGTTMVLSTTAFGMITQQSVELINIEFTP